MREDEKRHSAFATPRSVYIHVPFCRHRCGYCNFALVAGRDYLVQDYLKALAIELSVIDRPAAVDTIYVGGGTPSHLSPVQLQKLLELIDATFELDSTGEFTLEVNPEDLPGLIARELIGSAVNRISLGVQSFDSSKLRLLDRHHSVSQIQMAIDSALRITNRISIDLMFGIAEESMAIWQRDLEQAVALPVEHVSTYELTLEKGTRFWNADYHGTRVAASDTINATLYRATIGFLKQNGFEHYEISSFAKPAGRSRHNEVYWSGNSYWAFGPGAASFVDGVRRVNHRSVSTYLRRVLSGGHAVAETQRLSSREIATDQLVFGLRRLQGIDVAEFRHSTGFEIAEIAPQKTLDDLFKNGHISMDANRLRLTDRGLMFCDFVCQSIINAPHRPADK